MAMAERVRSINQSGGITAETVNIERVGDIGGHKDTSENNRSWLYAAAAVATILATLIGALEFTVGFF
jgi:hypothetical protein